MFGRVPTTIGTRSSTPAGKCAPLPLLKRLASAHAFASSHGCGATRSHDTWSHCAVARHPDFAVEFYCNEPHPKQDAGGLDNLAQCKLFSLVLGRMPRSSRVRSLRSNRPWPGASPDANSASSSRCYLLWCQRSRRVFLPFPRTEGPQTCDGSIRKALYVPTIVLDPLEQPKGHAVRVFMEQLRSDFAAITQPGYWIALGLLIVPYGVGVVFLVRTCHCL